MGRAAGRLSAKAVMLVAVMTLVAGCGPSGSTTTVPAEPPSCPFTSDVAMFAGDSLATHWPQFLSLAPTTRAFDVAQGGAAFGGIYNPKPGMQPIGAQVLAQLGACGNGLRAVVISGGINDLTQGQSAAPATAAIQALDNALFARGVRTIMLTIHPIAPNTPTAEVVRTTRTAVNTWMTTPGRLHATVVNCQGALESSPGSDVLRAEYQTYLDFWTVDPVHLNDAGYAAMARCAQPAIRAVLG